MKLHPKAKAALRHLIDCEKSPSIRDMLSVTRQLAEEVLEKYAPEISARFDCINSQTIEEAEHADAWFNYSYKEYMIQDHHDVKHVEVFHQIHLPNELNDIPF